MNAAIQDDVLHRAARGGVIAGNDRINDAHMGVGDIGEAVFGWRRAYAEHADESRFDEAAERPHEGIVRGFGDREVKTKVGECEAVGRMTGRGHLERQPTQHLDILGIRPLGDETSGEGFEGESNIVELQQKLFRHTIIEVPGDDLAVEHLSLIHI